MNQPMSDDDDHVTLAGDQLAYMLKIGEQKLDNLSTLAVNTLPTLKNPQLYTPSLKELCVGDFHVLGRKMC